MVLRTMSEALYTSTFIDFLDAEVTPNVTYELRLEQTICYANTRVTASIAQQLIKMLKWKYSYWEICEEVFSTFLLILRNKILAYSDYYVELLNAYNTQIDFLDGKKTLTTRGGSTNTTGSATNTNEGTNKRYELPNKTINEGRGNLSNETDTNNEDTSSTEVEELYDETITTKGDVDVVDAKRRYLDLIRNLYSEWAEKCEPCFLGIFS